MQIVSEKEIVHADSLFKVNLGNRVQTFTNLSWEDRLRLLGNDLWHVGLKIVVSVAIFIVGRWLIGRLMKALDSMFEKWNLDYPLRKFIRSTTKTLLFFVLFYIIIFWLGVDTSLFVAMFAAAGLAIGMAMSGVFQNLAGGVMVLITKPFRCGDWIELQGQAGTVMDMRLFNTILRTADNRTILLPNSGVFTSIIANHTLARTRRLEWPVSLNLNSDFEAAQNVILKLLAAEKKINSSPEPIVVLNQITSDSINLLVRAWVGTADYWDVYFKMSAAIYKTLTDAGFDMGTLSAIKVSRDED